ncbi:P-loop containing nucleoside triphosphate hydrolase protein [Immersiella caudata]|uniref:P-loop containing nucleoside triphosphate hydrolase protein n=1 Tax=Immersiella caudata TaxID=314043 RepID=A0AA39WE03_9PEZI|nr:P-loop containing nucleoside triphosphate hydrolase protein [Immersiella caudata]
MTAGDLSGVQCLAWFQYFLLDQPRRSMLISPIMSPSDSGNNNPIFTPISPTHEGLPDLRLEGPAISDKTAGAVQIEIQLNMPSPTAPEGQVPHTPDKDNHSDAGGLWETAGEHSGEPAIGTVTTGAGPRPRSRSLDVHLDPGRTGSQPDLSLADQAKTPSGQDVDGNEANGAEKANGLLQVKSKRKPRRRSKGRRKVDQEPETPSWGGLGGAPPDLLPHSEHSKPPEGSSPSTVNKRDSPGKDESHLNPFGSMDSRNQFAPLEDLLKSSSAAPEMSAKGMWERMKERGESNNALDRLMTLVGLEDVKIQFLKIKATSEAVRQRKGQLRWLDLSIAFMGNPGTGKTTVAKIYQDFLIELEVWRDGRAPEIAMLEDLGPESAWEFPSRDEGDPDNNPVIVVTGSVLGVSQTLASRPQSRWECWRRVRLPDFDDEHLRVMLLQLIERSNLQVDGGAESPYPLMLAKRVGRRRSTDGFANVHEIALAFEQTLERQAYRLKQAQLNPVKLPTNAESSNKALIMEDFMGPEPAELWAESAAWKELDRMAGLEDVKKAIRSLMRRSKTNYRRELRGKEPLHMSLNCLFLGPPGTGKTTVAKLYAQLLGELGLLSSKEIISTIPSNFIGSYTGETENKTITLIDSAAGKALIIDDAHSFFARDESLSTGDDVDSFRRAAIDTLVSQTHNRPGEDRCVILIGYADKMEEMFRMSNPGLKRRFPLEEAFRFHDYNDQQLNEILRIKMAKEEITANKEAMDVAAEVLRRARDRPNFGNGGDIDNLLNQAKARFRERKAVEKEKGAAAAAEGNHTKGSNQAPLEEEEEDDELIALEPRDFDPEWDRGTNSNSSHTSSLFAGLLGFDEIRKQFEGYQLMASNMRLRGKDPRQSIPFTYVFAGPPGTGKTHTARIMGKMFYRMGFLSTDEVIECSASNMVGQYAGHTAPKVVSLLESALGKVLFIDEAYRLTSRDGGLESEAIGELVDCMTKPRFLRKMIIILAGYNKDMNQLLKSNAGLRGRFPTEIRFKAMGEELSRDNLVKLLGEQDITIRDEKRVSSEDHETVLRLFYKLGMTEGWSNGRDIQSLANVITAEVYKRMPVVGVLEGSGGENGAEGKKTETGDKSVAGLEDLHISTKELIKFLKDLLRERIKTAASGEKSGDSYSSVTQ